MPSKPTTKKKTATKAKKPVAAKTVKVGTMKGGLIADTITVGRDFIAGNQYNDYRQQIANITTPAQFIAEAEKMQTQIAEAKKQPALPPAQQRRIEIIEGDIKEVVEEAKKENPNPKTMSDTLKSAAETMEGVGKAVEAAQGVGEKIDKVARSIDWGRLAVGAAALGDLAMKIFGALPH